MSWLLWRSSLRYFLRHRWLALLSILGVALGVGVVVSVDVASESARASFERSTEAVTGQATHEIRGATDTIDGDVYRIVRAEFGLRDAAPVVEGYVTESHTGRVLQVLGVDPFAEQPFRPYVSGSAIELESFMARPGTAAIAQEMASYLGLGKGDSLRVTVDGVQQSLELVALLDPADEHQQRSMQNLLLMDVASAQELFRLGSALSRIDIKITGETESTIAALEASLPEGARIQRSEVRTETVEQMTRAFNMNLTALSLLGLVVGMFLIYSTMTFAVVQRREWLGRLRAIGVTRGQIFQIILAEAALIGLAGTALGLLLGSMLAQVLVELVTQTISDLYVAITVQELLISPLRFVIGAFLGVAATILAALIPAREAASIDIVAVLRRSSAETRLGERKWLMLGGAIACVLVGIAALFWPSQRITWGYAALCFFLLAAAFLTPWVIAGSAQLLGPPLKRAVGVVGQMAARSVEATMSRSAMAIAALAIAVSATIGVGIMVDSFRQTVEVWLDHSLQADVYIQPPDVVFRRASATILPEAQALIQQADGVRDAAPIRRVDVATDDGPSQLAAVEPSDILEDVYRLNAHQPDVWQRFSLGDKVILISEPYGYRTGKEVGDILEIQTDRGWQQFEVSGVFVDYASDQGTLMMNRNLYRQLFNDDRVSGIAVHLQEGIAPDLFIQQLQADVHGTQELFIRSNQGLREASLEIFDQTFAITAVLRILTILVACVGVFSALMALQLERSREMAVLRANGLTPGQSALFASVQTGLMGLIAGLIAVPLGLVLAHVLTFVINQRSFGWTLQFHISPSIIIQAILLSVLAALFAAIYPTWVQSRQNTAAALKQE